MEAVGLRALPSMSQPQGRRKREGATRVMLGAGLFLRTPKANAPTHGCALGGTALLHGDHRSGMSGYEPGLAVKEGVCQQGED